MQTVGLSKMGLNSTSFYRKLLNSINLEKEIEVECVKFNKEYDFILLDGGSDVSPIFYGEVNTKSYTDYLRDEYEESIYNHYKDTDTKFVGICRGLQFLNIMCGGTLYQHLGDYNFSHNAIHDIEVNNSVLPFLPKFTVVNSLHHQGIKDLGKGLLPLAVEVNTKVIEIIHSIDNKIRAVQFHPEWMDNYPHTKEILRWLFSYY